MSLDVKILGLDQKSSVDFNDGSVTQANFVQLALPGGEILLALVDDVSAQKILLAVQSTKKVFKGQPSPPPVQEAAAQRVAFAARPADVQQPSFDFGGNGAADDDAFFENEGNEEDEPVIPPQLGPQLTRVRAPSADEAGNPVDAAGVPLHHRTQPSQEEAVLDEDGVRGL